MNKSSKLRGLILVGALVVAMAGCGNEVQGEQEAAPEVTPEATLEATQELAPEPVELAAGFDEEFVLKPDEELYIGREGISIRIDWISYDEYGTTFAYYISVDGKEIWGLGIDGVYVDNQVYQDEFTENRVICVDAEEDKNVTLKITSGTVIPEPLVLSGNAEDEYVTTKPEYVENDKIILFLAEGVKVYGNTMELIEKLIGIAEKETGLYLENDSAYSEMTGNNTDSLYGQETFPGVEPNGGRFHVYVVDDDVCSPCAYDYGIAINPIDLEIAAGEGGTIVHEVVHCLQTKNGIQMDSVMDEGFATYMTGRICDKDEEMIFNFDATMNYSYYETEITKENAEEIFKAEKEDNWENYLYGYRFITYLFETYGENIYKDILNDASPEVVIYLSMSSQEMVPYIKKHTADTVFEDFAEWLAANKSRFEYH